MHRRRRLAFVSVLDQVPQRETTLRSVILKVLLEDLADLFACQFDRRCIEEGLGKIGLAAWSWKGTSI